MVAGRKIAFLASLGFAQEPAEQVVETLAGLGYDGVEWTMSHLNPHGDPRAARQAVDATRAAGLEVSELVVQQDPVTLDEGQRAAVMDTTLKAIDLAAELGISTINVFTGPAPWDPAAPKLNADITERAAWDLVSSAFEAWLTRAEQRKVTLAVETVFGMLVHDYYTLLELNRRFSSSALRVNWDPSHAVLHGQDPIFPITALGDKIAHFHLKDAVGTAQSLDLMAFPMLGEGRVDWTAFFEAASEIGYEGFYSVEYESFGYYAKVLRSPVRAARVSIMQVKALLGAD